MNRLANGMIVKIVNGGMNNVLDIIQTNSPRLTAILLLFHTFILTL